MASDDTEALQTDIMRFLSILGFCLMIIFALVQSLPPPSTTTPAPQAISEAMLTHQIESYQAQVAQLKQQLEALQAAHQQQKQQWQQQLNQSQQRLNQSAQQLQQEHTELQTLQRQVNQQGQKLAKIQQQINQLTQPKPKAKPPAQAQPKKPERPIETAPPAPKTPKAAKKGFSLGFVSDADFINLLNQQRIALYLVQNKQAWQISASGQPTKAQSPNALYQLARHTVPKSLEKRLKQRITLHPNAIIGITLQPAMVEKIRQLMQQHEGGDLMIDGQGKVRLE
jgi:small-conductance mechanosensitive channel